MRLLDLHCKKMKSEVIWSSDYEKMLSRKKYFSINKNGEFLEFPFPNLEGTHQVVNATTAITALLHLNIPQKHIVCLDYQRSNQTSPLSLFRILCYTLPNILQIY